jgi:hypothetical protein
VAERTPLPEVDTTDATGYEWLGRFMEAQASVAANSLFTAFKLGQLGVAGKFDEPLARAMIADLRTDKADLAFAAAQLDKVLAAILENAERNLEATL